MKNFNESVHSLMKVAPCNDVYHEPKQTYVQHGGWFGVGVSGKDGAAQPEKIAKGSKRLKVYAKS